MKALSIQQPWAWLIVNSKKSVENRTWATRFRGRVMIHAGKKLDVEGHAWVRDRFPDLELPRVFECGGIVGEAVLADCVTDHPSPWFFGPYAFVFTAARPLPFRALRGQLGLFEVPDA